MEHNQRRRERRRCRYEVRRHDAHGREDLTGDVLAELSLHVATGKSCPRS